jgi:hypothetical protein
MKRLTAARPVLLALALALAGCSAAAPNAPSPSPTQPSANPSPASKSPGEPPTPPDDGVIGGGGGGANPQPGQPTLVLPKPGQLDVHDVAIEQLTAKVAGRHVVVNAQWWSGVEPCNVLDSVAVERAGQTITISVREGSSDRAAMCIQIAMLKVTAIDLGELEPGEYMIAAATGSTAAIALKVS